MVYSSSRKLPGALVERLLTASSLVAGALGRLIWHTVAAEAAEERLAESLAQKKIVFL